MVDGCRVNERTAFEAATTKLEDERLPTILEAVKLVRLRDRDVDFKELFAEL
jgi:hypothetical protein